MEQTFSITGMHCGGCVRRVQQALAALADSAEVTLDPPQAVLVSSAPLTLVQINAALTAAGDYRAA